MSTHVAADFRTIDGTTSVNGSAREVAAGEVDAVDFQLVAGRIESNLGAVIKGKSEALRLVLISLLAGGHTLLEDVPGTGKTTLAKALARSIGGEFRRIQFTPDLLPADITGSSFYRPADGTFEFREGPIFANVVLADEINRTSPRTQSALLEVMSENQITIEGLRRDLPSPFFVVATQNPGDFHGTYPLPEAQMDRFTLRLALGYPDMAHELEVVQSHLQTHPMESLAPVVSCREMLDLQEQVRQVRLDPAVAEYMLRLINRTRHDARLRLGVSPRGSLALARTSQARARLEGRDFVLPEDVRALAVATLAHRLALDTKAKYAGVRDETIIEEALESVPVPR
jgi:MoxR-like ATPase